MSLHAHVEVRLGQFQLDTRVDVGDGEVVTLLGPNGAGKTTLLRALAGLQAIDGGFVELGGRTLENPATGVRLATAQRAVGVVFQDNLLFPHLTALDNVAFGPRARGVPVGVARHRAAELLARIGLSDCADRRPGELSGGQAQRVALARALVTEPALLLLDEPLASLDVETRQQVRMELRRHLDEFPGPVVLITHDPLEAITLADRLMVLEEGRLVQDDVPGEVVSRPRSSWVAQLVGTNLFHGHSRGSTVELASGVVLHTAAAVEGEVQVVVHPQAVSLYRHAPQGSPHNVLKLDVVSLDARGDRVRVTLDGAVRLVAEITTEAAGELDLARGGGVHAAFKAVEVFTHPY